MRFHTPLPAHALALMLVGLFLPGGPAAGRAAAQEDAYVPETDPLVLAKLEHWQDLKLGLLMHWGPYSQWGVVESWSICPEDVDWIAHRSIEDYAEYKRAYENLQTTFDPRGFDPDRWAEAARDAGMKYVVFTTKHHDGFAMFDTRQSDYRITSPKTPFSTSPQADVTRAIFDAFRSRDFMIGAYFSKPDWHSEDYWWPYFATPDRNPNYLIARYPDPNWRIDRSVPVWPAGITLSVGPTSVAEGVGATARREPAGFPAEARGGRLYR